MCIGLPLRVITAAPGRAVCEGRGEVREVETVLLGDCEVGDWLLVFLGSARERISAERAHEVNAALDLLAHAMGAAAGNAPPAPGFTLPSAMDAAQLAAFTGISSSEPTTP